MTRFLSALLVTLFAGAAVSQESGEALVTLDGVEYVAELDGEQSDWDPSGSVSMAFRSKDRDALASFAGFSLSFSFQGPSAYGQQLDLVLLPEGKLERLFSKAESESGGLVVELENVSQDAERLTMSGTLSGQLGTTDNFGRTVDLSNPVAVEAKFSVIVEQLDE